MQFTDAVAVSGTRQTADEVTRALKHRSLDAACSLVPLDGEPPVEPRFLHACRRALIAFAVKSDIPFPLSINWVICDDIVGFTGRHDGQTFGIGAPKAH